MPGLGVIKPGYSGLECDNSVRKVVGSVDSGLVSLYLKSHPLGGLLPGKGIEGRRGC